MAEERKPYVDIKREQYNKIKLKNKTIKAEELKKRIAEDKELLKLSIRFD